MWALHAGCRGGCTSCDGHVDRGCACCSVVLRKNFFPELDKAKRWIGALVHYVVKFATKAEIASLSQYWTISAALASMPVTQ